VVPLRLLPVRVLLQSRRIHAAELLGHELGDHIRNLRRMEQEHPEHPHRAPLHRSSKAVVAPPLRSSELQRGFVQEEELLQLLGRRVAGEPAVAGYLLFREILN